MYHFVLTYILNVNTFSESIWCFPSIRCFIMISSYSSRLWPHQLLLLRCYLKNYPSHMSFYVWANINCGEAHSACVLLTPYWLAFLTYRFKLSICLFTLLRGIHGICCTPISSLSVIIQNKLTCLEILGGRSCIALCAYSLDKGIFMM